MEKIFERPILIWSDYCNYSKNFLNALIKHNQLYESFIRLNIDVDPKTHKRPQLFYQIQTFLNFKINQVPTIIVNNGEYILSGVEAFKWLDYTINKQQVVKKEELQGFNPIEMGSFSDSYAKFGSTKLHDATEQCFKFINKEDDKIETPEEFGTLTQEEIMKRQRERESIDISSLSKQKISSPHFSENFTNTKKELNLSDYTNVRNDKSFMPKVSNSRIDFTNDSFGFSGQMNNNSNKNLSRSQLKQNEIDMRLQQLLADRESTVPQIGQRI